MTAFAITLAFLLCLIGAAMLLSTFRNAPEGIDPRVIGIWVLTSGVLVALGTIVSSFSRIRCRNCGYTWKP